MNRIITSTLLCLATTAGLLGCSAPANQLQTAADTGASTRHRAEPAVARSEIAQGIYELVYSDKQGVLFVASAGSFKDASVPQQVLVVDPASLSVIDKINLPRRAFSLALDDGNDRLYVGNTGQGAVTVIDTRTRKVLHAWQLIDMRKGKDGRERPQYHFRQLALDLANHRLYIVAFDNKESSLLVVDTRTGNIEKTIPGFGFTATGLALDAKHSRLYVSNMQGEGIVVDTGSHEIVKRSDLGVEQPLNLAYDSANHRLLAVDQGHPKMLGFQQRGIPGYQSRHPGNRVVAIDLATGKTVAELEARGPINLEIDPTRQRLFVTNRVSGEVTVFDSNDYRKLHSVSLPPHPNTLALNSKTGEMFVTVKNDEDAPQGVMESVARIRF